MNCAGYEEHEVSACHLLLPRLWQEFPRAAASSRSDLSRRCAATPNKSCNLCVIIRHLMGTRVRFSAGHEAFQLPLEAGVWQERMNKKPGSSSCWRKCFSAQEPWWSCEYTLLC